MGKTIDVVLVLVGHFAGKTVTLRGYRFFEGKMRLTGAEEEVAGLAKYLRKSYQAFPEGSRELAEAQARIEGVTEDGKCDTDSRTGNGADNNLQGEVQQVGSGPEAPLADDGPGADDSAEGQAGSVPNGDGHLDAGIPVAPGTGEPSRLRQALKKLDHNNDEHWSKEGVPRMDAIQDFYGSANVSRKAVEAHAPGFLRGVELD